MEPLKSSYTEAEWGKMTDTPRNRILDRLDLPYKSIDNHHVKDDEKEASPLSEVVAAVNEAISRQQNRNQLP